MIRRGITSAVSESSSSHTPRRLRTEGLSWRVIPESPMKFRILRMIDGRVKLCGDSDRSPRSGAGISARFGCVAMSERLTSLAHGLFPSRCSRAARRSHCSHRDMSKRQGRQSPEAKETGLGGSSSAGEIA